jgi:hypothetical protein
MISLLRIERASLLLIVNLNPSSLLRSAVRERSLPSSLRFGSCEPETKQMPSGCRGEVIGISRSGVEYVGCEDEVVSVVVNGARDDHHLLSATNWMSPTANTICNDNL